jgi:WD40 repeat protein
MIDASGHAWLIDFGLATLDGSYLQPPDSDASAQDSLATSLTHGPVGTPRCMAPEQFDQISDRRTDVWGLGAMLYELVTLRHAFEGDSLQKLESLIRSQAPPLPRQLVPGLAPDLEAICLKALQKTPDRRYQTAADLGEDLRHWLRQEPTAARRLSAMQRAQLWSRRNPGWAAAILSYVIGAIALAVLLVSRANTRAASFLKDATQQSQQTLILRAQQAQAYPRAAGWSTESWSKLQQLDGILSPTNVQPIAAAALAGLDAVRAKEFRDLRITHAAWNSCGQRLLMASGKSVYEWDVETDHKREVSSGSEGPVAYTHENSLVQLRVIDDAKALELFDLTGQARRHRFEIPDREVLHAATLSDDGGVVSAATADLSDDASTAGHLYAWSGRTGKLLQSIALPAGRISSVTVCDELAAIIWAHGGVSVWSLSTGQPVALPISNKTVKCLAFARDYVRSRDTTMDQQDRRLSYLFATGDNEGTATVWDLRQGVPRAICHGAEFGVESVHFSGDGSTLAVASNGVTQLWDTAMGRHLLDLAVGSPYHLARLSPDGTRLFLSHQGGQTDCWVLSHGRGVQSFRGLGGQVLNVIWSRDGKQLAGVSHARNVGVWDSNGRLQHVFPLEKALLADNAAIAFDPNAKLLATASGSQADLWDLKTGKLKQSWLLPAGFVDLMAFPTDSRLLLARNEPQDNRYVFRLRNLMGGEPLKPLAEINDFPGHVFDGVMSRDGTHWTLDGLRSVNPWVRSIRTYDGAGREINSLSIDKTEKWGALVLDSDDKILALHVANGPDWDLVEAGSGKLIGREQGSLRAMAQRAKKRLKGGVPEANDSAGSKKVGLYLESKSSPAIVLELGRHVTSTRAFAFSPDGRYAAWGNRDGTVTVSDFAEVQRRLAELGLGWD